MKRIFLLAGVLGFAGAVSAQQNDLFDVEEHLKKKADQPFWNKPTDINLLTLKNAAPAPSLSFTYLISGEKLLQLPVDHMPCVVPDMDLFSRMPNAAHVIVLRAGMGSIPNSAPPLSIK